MDSSLNEILVGTSKKERPMGRGRRPNVQTQGFKESNQSLHHPNEAPPAHEIKGSDANRDLLPGRKEKGESNPNQAAAEEEH